MTKLGLNMSFIAIFMCLKVKKQFNRIFFILFYLSNYNTELMHLL